MVNVMTILAQSPDATIPVPSPDPLGYPLPAWILQALSYLTLTLHLTAVHFTVGGGLLLLWARLRRGSGHDQEARFLGSSLPLGVSYIVTLGVPPLLFVQVLYGQLFYASSVLLGAFWIQVIPALIVAYTGFYYHKLQREARPRLQGAVVAVSTVLLLYVGYIYVGNLTLLMSPDKWLGLYGEHPGGGVLHHGEPTLHGRYLLFLASSFGVAGLALIWRGVFLARWGDGDAAGRSRSLGFRAFLLSPILWVVAGIGVYFARPDEMGAMLSSGVVPKVLVAVGVIAAVMATAGVYLSVSRGGIRYPLLSSVAVLAVTACMVVFRDLVRSRELSPYWDASSVPVNAQWGMFTLFVVALVGGVALLVVLSRKVFPGIAQGVRE